MEKLVLLVGSNPLPNYLTAMALKPQRVLLVYSSQTTEPKDRLRDVLRQKGFEVEKCCVPATDARSIRVQLRAEFKTLPPDSHLNYTGGTKTMAAHARMEFAERCRENGGSDCQASYLDEGTKNDDGIRSPAFLRFDDGRAEELSRFDVSLTREVLLQLHGITTKESGDVGPPLPTPSDVDAIRIPAIREIPPKRDKTSDKPTESTLSDRLFRVQRAQNPDGEWLRNNWKQAEEFPVRMTESVNMDAIQIKLSIDQLPSPDWEGSRKQKESRFERWQHFLHGGWLEEWVGDLCRAEMKLITDKQQVKHWEVAVGLNCFRGERQVEMDVLLLRDHRFYALSCTTSRDIGLCKLKLFEAVIRARQLGGDLARAALVCFLDGDHNNQGPKAKVLEDEMREAWDAPNTPRVFGLDDMRTWMGTPEVGVAPNTESLRAWLES